MDEEGDDPPVVSTSPEPPPEYVLVPGPPVTRFERTIRTITLTEEDLAQAEVGGIRDAAPASFTWADGAGVGGPTSASSLHEGLVTLTTTVTASGPGMRAVVSIENAAERTKVSLAGRLSLELTGARGGRLATLGGGEVDVVLNPGGASTAEFGFRLPSGSYGARGVFEAR